MIFLLSTIFKAIINILPTDPLQAYIGTNVSKFSFLPYLNWVIPFDIFLDITKMWVTCVVLYYVYSTVKKIIFDFILAKLFN